MRLAERTSVAIVAIACVVACGRIEFHSIATHDGSTTDGTTDGPTNCAAGEARLDDICVPAIATDPSLVAYWPLDEGAGATTFHDLSPYGNDGTCSSCPTAGIAGVRGSAVELGGSDSIGVGDGASLTSLSAAVTVLGWERLNDYSEYGYILSNDRDCGSCGNYAGFGLWGSHYSSGPAFDVRDGTSMAETTSTTTTLSLGEWHFVAGTFDGTTSNLYVDGELASSRTDLTLVAPPSFELRLGAMGAFPTLGVDGAVDEVMVFSRALDASEISTLYAYYVAL